MDKYLRLPYPENSTSRRTKRFHAGTTKTIEIQNNIIKDLLVKWCRDSWVNKRDLIYRSSYQNYLTKDHQRHHHQRCEENAYSKMSHVSHIYSKNCHMFHIYIFELNWIELNWEFKNCHMFHIYIQKLSHVSHILYIQKCFTYISHVFFPMILL